MAENWVQVPLNLLKLPAELLLVYCAVRSFDWQRDGSDRAGCTASARTIGELIGKGERQVRRCLARLERCKVLGIERASGERLRIRCSPEDFDPALATPVIDDSPPVMHDLGPPRSSVTGPPVMRDRTPRSSVTGVPRSCMTTEVDTDKQKQEVETGSRFPGGSATAPGPGQQTLLADMPGAPAKAPRKRSPRPAAPAPSSAVWDAYSQAYAQRYGTQPVRNAKVNTQLAQLVQRLGAEESPQVAAFYLRHKSAFYAERGHPADILVRDAEKLRTEWATGQEINPTTARMRERTAANPAAAYAEEVARRAERLSRD